MRVLINCESSGVVRRAFQARGHEVYSCDLLPADDGETTYHIQADAISVANEPWRYPQISTPNSHHPWWDLMIAHPPCTYMTNAGVRHLHPRVTSRLGNRAAVYGLARWKELKKAVAFFNALNNANIERIAIENPIPHKYARDGTALSLSPDSDIIAITIPIGIGKYTQIIQPWMFGHPERKATCLWLKNLPKLTSTKNVLVLMKTLPKRQQQRLHYLSPSKDRWKIRSQTFEGIAKAMAEQWG